jgi:hypothetical protein
LAMVAIVDLTERLVIDHDRSARCQARSWGPSRAADVARMSWPSRNKRSVVRAISSSMPTGKLGRIALRFGRQHCI